MDDCLSVCNRLKVAAACCERELNDALADLGMSHCQATVLQVIAKDTLSMSDVSKHLCCHKSNVTQVVSGLLKKDFVRRAAHSSDRRVSRLSLTPKGRTVMKKLDVALRKRACDCMEIFSPAEKKKLSALLKKYIDGHRPS